MNSELTFQPELKPAKFKSNFSFTVHSLYVQTSYVAYLPVKCWKVTMLLGDFVNVLILLCMYERKRSEIAITPAATITTHICLTVDKEAL